MSDTPVVVFASFRPSDGKVEQVSEILQGMRTATRTEPGNEVYDLYSAEQDGAPSFHLIERYRNSAALQAHRDTDHYKAYRAAIPELLHGPIGVVVLTEVG